MAAPTPPSRTQRSPRHTAPQYVSPCPHLRTAYPYLACALCIRRD